VYRSFGLGSVAAATITLAITAPSNARAAASPIPADAPITSATRPVAIDIAGHFLEFVL